MNTYFSKDFSKASKWELDSILNELEKVPGNSMATIQWNSDDDSLYGVSYLDDSVNNPSDHGYIWHYEITCNLLAEVKAQIQINNLIFEEIQMDYNYSPSSEKDFCYNANLITQYNNICDDDYYDYYHGIALLLAVQIDMDQSKNFQDYIQNNSVKITHNDLMLHIHNKRR